MDLDIGPETAKQFVEVVGRAKTIVWNGLANSANTLTCCKKWKTGDNWCSGSKKMFLETNLYDLVKLLFGGEV
uniref:phosphoglycerate kinase n=1 Tax=Brugia malayi TaxID=6279 RepID=A0A0H5S0B2_BRUMA|nr:Bm7966 [Brugia malayi]